MNKLYTINEPIAWKDVSTLLEIITKSQKSKLKYWQMEYVIYNGNIHKNVNNKTALTCLLMFLLCDALSDRSIGSATSYIDSIRDDTTINSKILIKKDLCIGFRSVNPV